MRYPLPMYSVVGSDGQVYGPVDMATLAQWIAEGRVKPETNLIDPLDGRVIQAGQAPALMGTFPPTMVQTPPMPRPTNPYEPNVSLGQSPITPAGNPLYGGYPRPDMAAYYGPPKSKVTAALLAFFLGGLGIHRFYLGHNSTGIGILALFLLGFVSCGATWLASGIWALVDFILILTGGLREANGRALV